ncbi:MAG TPA: SIMPL domain-containing protein [Stellaceae bacterium]|nr:SIMPL domain-containing protein [Stellaceae bacterium]
MISRFGLRSALAETAGARGLLLYGILVLAAVPAAAQMPEPLATVLHLTQTAERKVVRDLLRVELRAEATGADPLALQAAVNRRMASALDRARQVQGVEVETGNYEVNEELPQNAAPRWRASQSLILTGRAADAELKLAGVLQSEGLLMSSISYQVSPETVRGAEEDLTAEALAGLAQRASSVAERVHLSVLRYRDLRVGNAETDGQPIPRFAAVAMAAPVAEPGEAVVRVTVSADLLLGPPKHP